MYNIPGVGNPSQPTGGPRPPGTAPAQPTISLEPEYNKIYEDWKRNPDIANNDRVLKALKPVIDTAVKTYAGSSSNPMVGSKAKQIVIDSLHRYDPSKTKLKTFVFNQLQGLKRFTLQSNQIISIPEQVQLDYVGLFKAEDELKEELGRHPSLSELADKTGLSPKRIEYVRKLRMPSSEGTVLKPMAGSESEDFNDPGVRLMKDTSSADGWRQLVYYGASDTDKIIMEGAFGMFGSPVLSNEAIAKKLRVTPAAVSIRKKKIQAELDKQSDIRLM